jgi:hypothetical protein
MHKINRQPKVRRRSNSSQRGVAAVEFALVVIIFLTFVFAVFEIARLMYVYNTLQEVTRRAASAAASTDFKDTAAIALVKQKAIFLDSPGQLPLGDPISDEHVRIEYLALVRNADSSLAMTEIPGSSLPSCREENRRICMENPNATNCIRFIRASICDPLNQNTCDPVGLKSLAPLLALTVKLPTAPTIATAESLGYAPGVKSCP